MTYLFKLSCHFDFGENNVDLYGIWFINLKSEMSSWFTNPEIEEHLLFSTLISTKEEDFFQTANKINESI